MAGVATAWVGDIAGGRAPRRPSSRLDIGGLHGVAIACGLLAAAPDLDFLVHAHRMYTHSVGATIIVCVATAMWCAARGLPLVSTTVLCGLAYGSHIPLDCLNSSELRSPGVMALWPWSLDYYKGYGLFGVPEWRLWPLDRFIWKNVAYMVREQIVFIPMLIGVYWVRQVAPRLIARRSTHQPTGWDARPGANDRPVAAPSSAATSIRHYP